jgi:hypothetical protein
MNIGKGRKAWARRFCSLSGVGRTAAALRNAATILAEVNICPETLARTKKLRDKVSAVISFFDCTKKHLGYITSKDVSRWRAKIERRA